MSRETDTPSNSQSGRKRDRDSLSYGIFSTLSSFVKRAKTPTRNTPSAISPFSASSKEAASPLSKLNLNASRLGSTIPNNTLDHQVASQSNTVSDEQVFKSRATHEITRTPFDGWTPKGVKSTAGATPYKSRVNSTAGATPYHSRVNSTAGATPYKSRVNSTAGATPYKSRVNTTAGSTPYHSRTLSTAGATPNEKRAKSNAGTTPYHSRRTSGMNNPSLNLSKENTPLNNYFIGRSSSSQNASAKAFKSPRAVRFHDNNTAASSLELVMKRNISSEVPTFELNEESKNDYPRFNVGISTYRLPRHIWRRRTHKPSNKNAALTKRILKDIEDRFKPPSDTQDLHKPAPLLKVKAKVVNHSTSWVNLPPPPPKASIATAAPVIPRRVVKFSPSTKTVPKPKPTPIIPKRSKPLPRTYSIVGTPLPPSSLHAADQPQQVQANEDTDNIIQTGTAGKVICLDYSLDQEGSPDTYSEPSHPDTPKLIRSGTPHPIKNKLKMGISGSPHPKKLPFEFMKASKKSMVSDIVDSISLVPKSKSQPAKPSLAKNSIATTDVSVEKTKLLQGNLGWGKSMFGNPTDWKCNGCSVKNPESASACLSCETARSGSKVNNTPSAPSTNSASTLGSNGFSFGISKKDDSSTPNVVEENKAPQGNLGWGKSMFGNPTDWKCDGCSVKNPESASSCLSCETARSGEKGKSTTAAPPSSSAGSLGSNGFSFGINKDIEKNDLKSNQGSSSKNGFSFGIAEKKESQDEPDVGVESKDSAVSKAPISGGFSFGAAPTNNSATSGFSFGSTAPAKKAVDEVSNDEKVSKKKKRRSNDEEESKAKPNNSGGFSFGKSSNPKESGFSFGTSVTKTDSGVIADPSASSGKAPATFSFGKGDASSNSNSTVGFSFGTKSNSSEENQSKKKRRNDLTNDRDESVPSAPAPGFAFGSIGSKSSATTPAVSAPPSFSFGTGSKDATSSITAPAPSVSFNSSTKSDTLNTSSTSGAPSFSFGGGTSTASNSAPNAPSFSFGSSNNTTSSAVATAAPAPSFSFGTTPATNPAAKIESAMPFGGGNAATPAFNATNVPVPSFGATNAAPNSASFSFGSSNANIAQPAQPPAFGSNPTQSFGSSNAPPASSGGFSFGNNPSSSSSSFGNANTPAPSFVSNTPSFPASSSGSFGQAAPPQFSAAPSGVGASFGAPAAAPGGFSFGGSSAVQQPPAAASGFGASMPGASSGGGGGFNIGSGNTPKKPLGRRRIVKAKRPPGTK